MCSLFSRSEGTCEFFVLNVTVFYLDVTCTPILSVDLLLCSDVFRKSLSEDSLHPTFSSLCLMWHAKTAAAMDNFNTTHHVPGAFPEMRIAPPQKRERTTLPQIFVTPSSPSRPPDALARPCIQDPEPSSFQGLVHFEEYNSNIPLQINSVDPQNDDCSTTQTMDSSLKVTPHFDGKLGTTRADVDAVSDKSVDQSAVIASSVQDHHHPEATPLEIAPHVRVSRLRTRCSSNSWKKYRRNVMRLCPVCKDCRDGSLRPAEMSAWTSTVKTSRWQQRSPPHTSSPTSSVMQLLTRRPERLKLRSLISPNNFTTLADCYNRAR